MPRRWVTPIYNLRTTSGRAVVIDVTTSVAPGLPPNKVLSEKVIPFFQARRVTRILDFGAGALRHVTPLLEAGMTVCGVEFEAAFLRPAASAALADAKLHPHFSRLVWPHNFLADSRKWDGALLCYVLQTMPKDDERRSVVRSIFKKLKPDSYLFYMSRYNQFPIRISSAQRVEDGYFMWPKRSVHSFYREFETDETHELFEEYGFRRIRSLSERGTDQIFLYAKGSGTWI